MSHTWIRHVTRMNSVRCACKSAGQAYLKRERERGRETGRERKRECTCTRTHVLSCLLSSHTLSLSIYLDSSLPPSLSRVPFLSFSLSRFRYTWPADLLSRSLSIALRTRASERTRDTRARERKKATDSRAPEWMTGTCIACYNTQELMTVQHRETCDSLTLHTVVLHNTTKRNFWQPT
jgi:hypothetical protein